MDKLERDIHEKGTPLTKTWRYVQSQFPATILHKDCRMGLLEVNTGFRFNIDFKTEEREPVKEIMTKLPPPNDKLCVNMNYRQSWGSVSQDKMDKESNKDNDPHFCFSVTLTELRQQNQMCRLPYLLKPLTSLFTTSHSSLIPTLRTFLQSYPVMMRLIRSSSRT